MRLVILAALALCAAALPALAQGYTQPARGTAERKNLMDAIRPHVAMELGAPVEFVIHDLRVAGNAAFASLWAQRPGGREIDMVATPMAARGDYHPDMFDGPTVQALLIQSGGVWVAMHWAIGATDVWWAWDGYCPNWHRVIPEVCG